MEEKEQFDDSFISVPIDDTIVKNISGTSNDSTEEVSKPNKTIETNFVSNSNDKNDESIENNDDRYHKFKKQKQKQKDKQKSNDNNNTNTKTNLDSGFNSLQSLNAVSTNGFTNLTTLPPPNNISSTDPRVLSSNETLQINTKVKSKRMFDKQDLGPVITNAPFNPYPHFNLPPNHVVKGGVGGGPGYFARSNRSANINPSIVMLNGPNSTAGGNSSTLNNYASGDLIVSVHPEKHSCVWLTPAKFNSTHVPPEILDPKLKITADDYSLAIELLSNDARFTTYTMCYKRILSTWLLFGFAILLGILFSGLGGVVLFAMGLLWLFVNTIGLLVCLVFKKMMNNNLDDAVSSINRILYKKNILMGMEDWGKLSCHKILIHVIYYDINPCSEYLSKCVQERRLKEKKLIDFKHTKHLKFLETSSPLQNVNDDIEQIMSVSVVPNEVPKSNGFVNSSNDVDSMTNYRLQFYRNYAEKLLLRNSQGYVKNMMRGRITIPHPELPQSKTIRHVKGNFCLCQYVEDYYLTCNPRKWYNVFY